ncbi:hypothetical protein G7Y89_g6822 [Cudoniella acicularis]|uniref:Uncharacterized protein n=1 Tax=Cudoniella acicularis TaxID=354080 RepID=A0A8H4RJP2_9HELO|nr:hypothetical protein G7Y89_g6822 [Cudoniella acicularis]
MDAIKKELFDDSVGQPSRFPPMGGSLQASPVQGSQAPPQKQFQSQFRTSISPLNHDYQMQLMLLEQQNKKRLMMARAEQDAMKIPGPAESNQTTLMGESKEDEEFQRNVLLFKRQHAGSLKETQEHKNLLQQLSYYKDAIKTAAGRDYIMQLMLLEQLNKKRLIMAKAEQDAMNITYPARKTQGQGSSAKFYDQATHQQSNPPFPGSKPVVPTSHLPDHQTQLPHNGIRENHMTMTNFLPAINTANYGGTGAQPSQPEQATGPGKHRLPDHEMHFLYAQQASKKFIMAKRQPVSTNQEPMAPLPSDAISSPGLPVRIGGTPQEYQIQLQQFEQERKSRVRALWGISSQATQEPMTPLSRDSISAPGFSMPPAVLSYQEFQLSHQHVEQERKSRVEGVQGTANQASRYSTATSSKYPIADPGFPVGAGTNNLEGYKIQFQKLEQERNSKMAAMSGVMGQMKQELPESGGWQDGQQNILQMGQQLQLAQQQQRAQIRAEQQLVQQRFAQQHMTVVTHGGAMGRPSREALQEEQQKLQQQIAQEEMNLASLSATKQELSLQSCEKKEDNQQALTDCYRNLARLRQQAEACQHEIERSYAPLPLDGQKDPQTVQTQQVRAQMPQTSLQNPWDKLQDLQAQKTPRENWIAQARAIAQQNQQQYWPSPTIFAAQRPYPPMSPTQGLHAETTRSKQRAQAELVQSLNTTSPADNYGSQSRLPQTGGGDEERESSYASSEWSRMTTPTTEDEADEEQVGGEDVHGPLVIRPASGLN